MGSSDRFGRSIRLGDSRWLSLKVAIPAFHLVIASEKCRSILCFNMAVNCDREWYLRANSFKKLRVLDLSKIKFASECTMEVFLRIPIVKELGIIAGDEEALPQGLINNLCCLSHLEKLKVQGSYHPLHLGPQATIYPQNLKKLTFVRTLIPWEDMNCISMLPNLVRATFFLTKHSYWEEMKEVTERIKGVSVKAEDDIEAELLKAHHYHKLEKTLQRVVHDVEELMQITRNTDNNNPT
nr:putative late blight resistance protein homolog R1B-17 [Ipomoea batatas]